HRDPIGIRLNCSWRYLLPPDRSLGPWHPDRPLPPQCLDGSMDQETHIADREPRDAADFLVTEAILELQANNLLLIGRQPVDQAQDDRQCFSGLEFRPGPR